MTVALGYTGAALAQALGLPKQTTEFTLHCDMGDGDITVECRYQLDIDRNGRQALEHHFRAYELHERKQEAYRFVEWDEYFDDTIDRMPPEGWRALIEYRARQALDDIDFQAHQALMRLKLLAFNGKPWEY